VGTAQVVLQPVLPSVPLSTNYFAASGPFGSLPVYFQITSDRPTFRSFSAHFQLISGPLSDHFLLTVRSLPAHSGKITSGIPLPDDFLVGCSSTCCSTVLQTVYWSEAAGPPHCEISSSGRHLHRDHVTSLASQESKVIQKPLQ
jgi:hypothetical protein